MSEFREVLRSPRVSRPISAAKACADDVGAVVTAIRQLLDLKRVLDNSYRLAALKLKTSKCFIVPL
eukprot:4994907-Pyramimonas_sp.AAC.1